MTEFDILKTRYSGIYNQRPSTIRSTMLYGPLGWLAGIIGYLLFVSGLGLLIATALHRLVIPHIDTPDELIWGMQLGAGALAFVIGLLLMLAATLCRRIVRRNLYILELEGFFSQLVE